MKHLPFAFLLIAGLSTQAQSPLTGNPSELPFTLDMEEVTQDELPGLHSGAFAQWDGWWVVIGGRIGGLHGFFPITGFPENEANTTIWLINPENGDLHNFPIDVLTVPFPDQLKSTNPQYVQDGDKLFICGGYGKEAASGNFVTFPILTAVQLPQLVSALISGANPTAAFRQIQVSNLRVCGGEMDKLGDFFHLVGGHDFSGKYSDPNNGSFTQIYTNEIRKFKIHSTSSSLSISDYSAIKDEQNLHRRDFTLSPVLFPNGTPGLCLFGGVFRPNAALPYYNPVYITENQSVALDAQYEQLFSQYTCPTVPLFDSIDGSMYTLFFAGLSAHYFDLATQSIKYDARVPFIKDITTFRRKADGSSQEFIMPARFDALLGTNMIFAPVASAPHYANEVLHFRQMSGKTFVGYLYGGIKAEIPNITPSSANNRTFKVYLTPKLNSGTSSLAPSKRATLRPNPLHRGENLVLETAFELEEILLFSSDGRLLATFRQSGQTLNQQLDFLLPGVYFLKLQGENQQETLRLVKMD